MFHNGVFGMFEDPRFEEGTRKFMAQLKRMTDAGIKVYVGGGEGGTALEKYGQPNWITYCFTAGGTVLNALGQRAGALSGRAADGGRSDGPCPHNTSRKRSNCPTRAAAIGVPHRSGV